MAHESTHSDSSMKAVGHIRTWEVVNQEKLPIKMCLTSYEQQGIAIVDVLLDLFGKHQRTTKFWDLDSFHRILWFHRAEQILSALRIEETEEIH